MKTREQKQQEAKERQLARSTRGDLQQMTLLVKRRGESKKEMHKLAEREARALFQALRTVVEEEEEL